MRMHNSDTNTFYSLNDNSDSSPSICQSNDTSSECLRQCDNVQLVNGGSYCPRSRSYLHHRKPEMPTMSRLESSMSISSINFTMPHMEERMRRRLKFFFMDPCQKYKAKRRKPFKLAMQILKIVLVTSQLILFGSSNQARVTFMEENQSVFKNIFLKKNSTLYSKEEFYNQIHTIQKEYSLWVNNTLGIYGYAANDIIMPENQSTKNPPPINMCIDTYVDIKANPEIAKFYFDPNKRKKECLLLSVWNNSSSVTDYITLLNGTKYKVDFLGLVSLELSMGLSTIWMKVPIDNEPDCYDISVVATLDNSDHSGSIRSTIDSVFHLKSCTGEEKEIDVLKILINFFDAIIIMACTLSFILCTRSLWKAQILRRTFEKFFLAQYNKRLSCSDRMEFFNGWYLLIIISDILTIFGTILKMVIQNKWNGLINYNSCSLFLGVGCLCVWIGVLRYVGFFHKYNLLVITLKKSVPHVGRFMVCASLLYLGFMFCGWVVLGPYHHKFRSLVVTSEALFSLINGDDMYMTYEEMSKKSAVMLVFSQVYLYTFISLFIYVVLSLFIAVIMDTYETIKDQEQGDQNLSEIQKFIAPCTADANVENYGFDRLHSATPCCCCFSFDEGDHTDEEDLID